MLRLFDRVASWGLHARIAVSALLLGAGILGLVATQGWAGSAQGRPLSAPPQLPKMQNQQAFKQPRRPPEPKQEAVKQPKGPESKTQQVAKGFQPQLPKGAEPTARDAAKFSEPKQKRQDQVRPTQRDIDATPRRQAAAPPPSKEVDVRQRLRDEVRRLQKERDTARDDGRASDVRRREASRNDEKDSGRYKRDASREDDGKDGGRRRRETARERAEAAAIAKAEAEAAAAAKAKAAADAAAKAAQSKPYTAPSVIVPTAPEPVTTTTTTAASTTTSGPSPASDAKPNSDDQAPSQSASSFDRPYGLGGPQQASASDDNRLGKNVADPRGAQQKKITDGGAGSRTKSFGLGIPPPAETYKPNELVVASLRPEVRQTLLDRGYQVKTDKDSGVARVLLPKDGSASAWELQRDLQKEFQQSFGLNFVYKAYRGATKPGEGTENGTPSARDYGPRLINWNKEQLRACESGIHVGMIDTVVDKSHRAFLGRNLTVIALPPREGFAEAEPWHGTGVLSVMAGAPQSSTPGLIPDAQFTAVGAFFKGEGGNPETDTEHLVTALKKLAARGAQIVNLSLVGPKDELVHTQIMEMAGRGVVFVAAAGNNGPGGLAGYPAAYEEVIAVTAVDQKKQVYDFANRGDYIDAAAPGVKIWAAQPKGQEGMLSGTSLAAPFVTAAVAVAYTDAVSRIPAEAQRGLLNPKAVMLDHLFGQNKKRDATYGRGLIEAPAGCGRGGVKQPWPAAVVSAATPARDPAPIPASVARSTWQPTVNQVSLPFER
jgi:Subtilase family